MRRFCLIFAVGIAMVTFIGLAQQTSTEGPYRLLKTAKVGGDGGFDYVYADDAGRRLYIPRTGPTPRINVFNLVGRDDDTRCRALVQRPAMGRIPEMDRGTSRGQPGDPH